MIENVGFHRDLARIHQACAAVIEATPGADTVEDVVRIRGAEHLSELLALVSRLPPGRIEALMAAEDEA